METGIETYDDVVVIGSGPAGIAAALTCLQAGLKVSVITNQQPGCNTTSSLPCETVHPGIFTLLKRIGMSGAVRYSSRGAYYGTWINNAFKGLGAEHGQTWSGSHIDRNKFNHYLHNASRQKGVNIIYNESVDGFIHSGNRIAGVKTKSGKLMHGWYVIDASGRQRIAGKKLKFREQFFSPPLVGWTGVACAVSQRQHKQSTRFIPSASGWTWLAFESLAGQCTWTMLAKKEQKKFEPPKELAGCDMLSAVKVSNMRWRVFRPLCSEGVLLCGDAAGILDPAAGQGILTALWSGIAAGNTVVANFNDPGAEQLNLVEYDQWYIERFEQQAGILHQHYRDLGIHVH